MNPGTSKPRGMKQQITRPRKRRMAVAALLLAAMSALSMHGDSRASNSSVQAWGSISGWQGTYTVVRSSDFKTSTGNYGHKLAQTKGIIAMDYDTSYAIQGDQIYEWGGKALVKGRYRSKAFSPGDASNKCDYMRTEKGMGSSTHSRSQIFIDSGKKQYTLQVNGLGMKVGYHVQGCNDKVGKVTTEIGMADITAPLPTGTNIICGHEIQLHGVDVTKRFTWMIAPTGTHIPQNMPCPGYKRQ